MSLKGQLKATAATTGAESSVSPPTMPPRPAWMDDRLAMQRCLSPEQVAELTGLALDSLLKLRRLGQGPKFVRLGERRLGYRVCDVVAWLDAGGMQD